MGFFESIVGGKKRGKMISANSTFRLTQEGREKLQDFSGDPKSKVLVALETRGTSNVDEISQSSGVSRGQVEHILPALIKGGYVQPVGGADDFDDDD